MNFKILLRQFSTSGILNSIKSVTVIGCGIMGSGIAQVAAQTGQNVSLVDVNKEVLEKSMTNINKNLQRVAKKLYKDAPVNSEKFVKEAMEKIKTFTDLKSGSQSSDLVIEAVTENISIKHKIFKELDEVAPSHAILASNTSSLSITEIGSVVKRKDKVGGLHFFNPVPVMRLLEVISTNETSPETHRSMMEWGKAVGKTCISCKDTPGFVVNRLLVPYMAEAVRMLERGEASSKDIDVAMKLGAGYPMGPFELTDFGGLDTAKYILDIWHNKYPDEQLFEPIPLLNKLVSERKLGVKTGEGFYKYDLK